MQGYDKYDGLVDCFNKIYKSGGITALFKGLVPCYLKVIPSTAILFMTNVKQITLKHFLGKAKEMAADLKSFIAEMLCKFRYHP